MKLKILVGSKAAKTHIPSFRDGSDIDWDDKGDFMSEEK